MNRVHFSLILCLLAGYGQNVYAVVKTKYQVTGVTKTTCGTVVNNKNIGHGNYLSDVQYKGNNQSFSIEIPYNFAVGSKYRVQYDSTNPAHCDVLITQPLFTPDEHTKTVIGRVSAVFGNVVWYRYPYTNFNQAYELQTYQYADSGHCKKGDLFEVEYLPDEAFDIPYPHRSVLHVERHLNRQQLKTSIATLTGLDSISKLARRWTENGDFILACWNLKFTVEAKEYITPILYSRFEEVGQKYVVYYDPNDPNRNYVALDQPAFSNGEQTAKTRGSVIKVKPRHNIIRYRYVIGNRKYKKYQHLGQSTLATRDLKHKACEIEYLLNDPAKAVAHVGKAVN